MKNNFLQYGLIFFGLMASYGLKAQDGYLLIQQYREGPALNNVYSALELVLIGGVSYWVPKNKNLTPKLNDLPQVRLLYRPAQSLAFTTGFEYLPIRYSYTQNENPSQDQLVYFSVPLGIRLFPYKKLHLGLTLQFNRYQKGKTLIPPKKPLETTRIPSGTLNNSVGLCASLDYNFWKKWRVEAQFRFTKKETNIRTVQTNSYVGWCLGISHPIFRSKPQF